MSRRVLLVLVLLLAACSHGDNLGPKPTLSLTGDWTINELSLAGTFQGSPTACALLGSSLSLTQSGTTVSGNYTTGTLTCTVGSQSGSVAFQGAAITGASLSGSSLRFFVGNIEINATYDGANDAAGTAAASLAGYGALAGAFRMTR